MNSKVIANYKAKIKLTKKQRSIIIGLMLGDGHLESSNNGQTYRLKVEHSIRQKDYINWLYRELGNIIYQGPKIRIKKLNGKSFLSIYFVTYSLGSLRFYAHQFYRNGKKVIPKLIKKLLNPLSLAVWFMDDGSKKSSKHNAYIIHTTGFSKKDLLKASNVLQEKFKITANIHKQYDKFGLYIGSESAHKFKKLIINHIIPSMRYKLG